MRSIFGLNSVRDEPYLTQVFSFVLNADKGYCNFLIRDIFKLPSAGDVKQVIAEDSTAIGIPDIRIICEELDIVIEIKIGADFTDKQIERYNDISSHVFLIYKFLKDPKQANCAENVYTWHHIYSRTKKYIEDLPNSYVVIKYRLEQFNLYLEETNMAIEKVSWEILKGTKALLNLGAQINESLERLLGTQIIIKYNRASATPDYIAWRVYTVKDLSFYIYIIYNPLFVMSYISTEDIKLVTKLKKLKYVHPELGWGDWKDLWHLETLDISKNYFLCLSVDEQIDNIIKFIEDSKDKIVMQVDKVD